MIYLRCILKTGSKHDIYALDEIDLKILLFLYFYRNAPLLGYLLTYYPVFSASLKKFAQRNHSFQFNCLWYADDVIINFSIYFIIFVRWWSIVLMSLLLSPFHYIAQFFAQSFIFFFHLCLISLFAEF